MKKLNTYILEKLILNKSIIHKYNQKNYQEAVDMVSTLAKEKGLDIVFRNKKTNAGDFVFFIYDKKKQKRYLTGYDGYWDSNYECNFDYCLKQVMDFIDKYK